MPLSPGARLGPYEIVAPLGEGGMGIVYKARDTRLNRMVAIKVLPAGKTADSDRKRRFVQEAQAASALNHPNIITIYDIGSSDGVDYIAMEYVVGKTLDALIPRRGMRLKEVLRIAIQIAAGLERAHAAGIVHRDLKPGNVMVAEDGLVKVLDFGLAKLAEPDATSADAPTQSVQPVTKEGSILGTVGYMSPEQAEAKTVDARSDIFSFGSMLYEMVTGERAFQGDSNLSTLAAILRENPKPVSSVVSDVPRDLEKLINRCLRKEPERRFQHMGDVRVALLELKEESDSGQLAAGAPATVRRSRRGWMAAALVIAVAACAGVWLWMRGGKTQSPLKTSLLTSYQGFQLQPALSPDGRQVAFSWNGEHGGKFGIYVKLVGAGAPLQLTSEADADDQSPAWSPDGRYIAFCRTSPGGSEIRMIPSLGGAGRKLAAVRMCTDGEKGFGLSWSPDAKLLAIPDATGEEPPGIVLLTVESGERVKPTSPAKGSPGDSRPRFAPDGKSVVFVRSGSIANQDLYALPVPTDGMRAGEPVRLTSRGHFVDGLDWAPGGGKIIFSGGERFTSNRLWVVSATGGEIRPFSGESDSVAWLTISGAANSMVCERWSKDLNIWRMPGPKSKDRSALPARFIASTRDDLEPQYSPDGKKIAFTSDRSGNMEIWVSDSEGQNASGLTSFGGAPLGSARWSPDGRSIAFDSVRSGNEAIYVISADGGTPRRFTNGTLADVRPSWSHDGREIYFGSNRTGEWQIWKAPVAGGAAVQVTRGGGEDAFESLDGKYLYWGKLGKPGIWRMPTGGGEEIQILSTSGRSLFAVAEPGLLFFDLARPGSPALKVFDQTSLRVAPFQDLPKGAVIDWDSTALSVSPDRRWILYTQVDQAGSNLMLVENLR